MRRTVPIEPMPPVMPRCWNDRQNWLEWVRLNKLAGTVDRAGSVEHFCVDCTKEYQRAMHREQRCAYPDEATRPTKVKRGA